MQVRLDDGRWVDGWLEAQRKVEGVWSGYVRYSTAPSETREDELTPESPLREPTFTSRISGAVLSVWAQYRLNLSPGRRLSCPGTGAGLGWIQDAVESPVDLTTAADVARGAHRVTQVRAAWVWEVRERSDQGVGRLANASLVHRRETCDPQLQGKVLVIVFALLGRWQPDANERTHHGHGAARAAHHNQLIGSTVAPSSKTMKCRWHPVEAPVVPT